MTAPSTINQVLDLPERPTIQVWGPALCLNNLVMITGETGIGKTYVCMKLAHTIASSGVFLNWGVMRPIPVLYIEGELGLPYFAKRFRQIQSEAPFSPRGDCFRVLSKDHCGARLWNISDPKDQKKYNEAIGHSRVVIFDNLLSCNFPVDSRDDEVKQWERITPWLHALRDSGRTIILVHHTGKNKTQLGTSIKENWLDTSIMLQMPAIKRPVRGTEFEWIWKKTRDVKRSDAVNMLVQYIEGDDGVSRWNWSPLGESQVNSVADLKAKGMSKREIARSLGLSYREIETAWE